MVDWAIDLLWFDLFDGGYGVGTSLRVAAIIAFSCALLYWLFGKVSMSVPIFHPQGALEGWLLPGGAAVGSQNVEGFRALLLALVFAVQVFAKLRIFRVDMTGSVGIRMVVLGNWLVGLYFFAGWAWVVARCANAQAECW